VSIKSPQSLVVRDSSTVYHNGMSSPCSGTEPGQLSC